MIPVNTSGGEGVGGCVFAKVQLEKKKKRYVDFIEGRERGIAT